MNQIYIDVVVSKLQKIFSIDFGGKRNGRFKISYQRLQQISGRAILNESFMERLLDCAFANGITIINLGNEFSIIETSILSGYRNVPQGIVDKILKE